ncbi:lasso peptide biosynthesis B2 protein [Azospirillum sp.]|uniref:lasso peptide biosynthesis B2 protein n=1 Tax=Azospirillum sp. TaxID=34012 RepID=UPI003D75CDE4
MRRAGRFLRLPAAERRLALEAVVTLTLVCALLKALPFARVMRLLGLREPGKASGGIDATVARAVRRAVARASRNLPFPAVCLPQAAAAAVMLRRRGLAAEVHFGVARRAGAIEAHAWSRSGEVTVSGGAERAAFAWIAVFRA